MKRTRKKARAWTRWACVCPPWCKDTPSHPSLAPTLYRSRGDALATEHPHVIRVRITKIQRPARRKVRK